MNKDIEMVLVLFGAIIFLWFGMSFLFIGRILYGKDASLLWAFGILSWFGIMGICNFILYLIKRNKE